MSERLFKFLVNVGTELKPRWEFDKFVPIAPSPTPPAPSVTPTISVTPSIPAPTPSASAIPPSPTPSPSPIVPQAFEIVVDTTEPGSPSDEIQLPIDITNGTIDWGDSTIDTNVTSTISTTVNHTYASAGVYTIKISPELTRIRMNNLGDRRKLIDIVKWGDCVWTSFGNAFWGCSNMDVTATDEPILTNCTTFVSFFRDCSSLSYNSSINNWDTSNITNIQQTFLNATTFNQSLSNWNVVNVTTFSQAFDNAASFNQDLGMWSLRLAGVNLNNTLRNSGLSLENYSRTLIGWSNSVESNSDEPNNVNLGASGLNYDCDNYGGSPFNNAVDARDYLVNVANWSITDDGQIGVCPTPTPSVTPTISITPSTPPPTPSASEIPPTPSSSAPAPSPTPSITPSPSPIVNNNFTMNVDTTLDDGKDFGMTVEGNNYTVNWGDTTIDEFTNSPATISHEYDQEGTYTIQISEGLTRIRMLDESESNRNKITEISQWGNIKWSNWDGFMFNCPNLDITATDEPILTGMTKMDFSFFGCTSLSGNTSIGNWNVSTIDSIYELWTNTKFNIDISSWDTSSLVGSALLGTFRGTPFNQPIGNWDVSGVDRFYTCFRESAFNQELNWDMSSVTTGLGLGEMFIFSPFNSAISGSTMTNVEDVRNMFPQTPFNQELPLMPGIKLAGGMLADTPYNKSLDFMSAATPTDMSFFLVNATSFNQPFTVNTEDTLTFRWMLRDATSFSHALSDLKINSGITDSNAFENMLNNTNLDDEAYSRTLINFANQVSANNDLPINMNFGAEGLLFNDIEYGGSPFNNAVAARNYLVNDVGWSITDAGEVE